MRIPDARRNFLRELRQHIKSVREYGFEIRVEWYGPGDDFGCCHLCDARQGRLCTIEEMEVIVRGRFCQPRDRLAGCRCCLLAYIDDGIQEREAELKSNHVRPAEAVPAPPESTVPGSDIRETGPPPPRSLFAKPRRFE